MKITLLEEKIRQLANSTANFILAYRAIILLLLMVGIGALKYIGRKSDFFEFPFNAGIWGTTSDWVMIAVTGVTEY